MAALSKDELAKILNGKAAALCSPQADRIMDEHVMGRGANPPSSMYDEDADELDAMFLSENAMSMNGRKSGMPEEIVRSITQNPLNATANNSVLDDMKIDTMSSGRRQMVENLQARVQPQVSGVDYTIIKAIVNECLNEYFSRKPINETATLETIGLQNGNITLVDNKGNVFRAKLNKIGNKNDLGK